MIKEGSIGVDATSRSHQRLPIAKCQSYSQHIPADLSGPVGFNMKFRLFEECGEAVASSGECVGAENGRMYCILLVAAADRASRPGA